VTLAPFVALTEPLPYKAFWLDSLNDNDISMDENVY